MTCQIEWGNYFRYEPDTGKLFWRISPSRAIKAGTEITYQNDGYLRVRLRGKGYFAHKIIWDLLYPNDPILPGGEIDHIDHNRTNNRPDNLRKVAGVDNRKNKSKDVRNSSGVTGVGWHSYHKKWQAKISVDGRRVYLGLFHSKDEAIAARTAAERKYGFHENHGK